jgi:pilus assembly protein CpaF
MMSSKDFIDMKQRVVAVLKAAAQAGGDRKALEAPFNAALQSERVILSRAERQRLFDLVVAEVLGDDVAGVSGMGPLEALLRDPDVTEIMINGPKTIYVERNGRLELTAQSFDDSQHLMAVMVQIAESLGRTLDESQPILDLRFPDRSMMHIVIPPIAHNGPAAVIRKFTSGSIAAEDLIASGTLTEAALDYLRDAVKSMRNIAISGLTGMGKTTLLMILAGAIDSAERIIVALRDSDVHIELPNVVVLNTRPANPEGRGEIGMVQLLDSAMRMRPERILVDPVEDGAAMTRLLHTLQSGHNGSMFTAYAAAPRDLLTRLEIMLGEIAPSTPVLTLREQLAASLDVIVQLDRLGDGTRQVTTICEVGPLSGGVIGLRDVFTWGGEKLEPVTG